MQPLHCNVYVVGKLNFSFFLQEAKKSQSCSKIKYPQLPIGVQGPGAQLGFRLKDDRIYINLIALVKTVYFFSDLSPII